MRCGARRIIILCVMVCVGGRTAWAQSQLTDEQLALAFSDLRTRIESATEKLRAGKASQSRSLIDEVISESNALREDLRHTLNQAQSVRGTSPLEDRAEWDALIRVTDEKVKDLGKLLNNARIRLMECCHQERDYGCIGDVAHSILSDKARGEADEDQMAWAFLWAARAVKASGDPQQAIDVLQGAIDHASKNKHIAFDAMMEMGWSYQALNDHAEADAAFGQAQTYAETHGFSESAQKATMELAESANRQGDVNLAIALLRTSIGDVAILTSVDYEVCRRIARLLGPEERVAWLEYLAAPYAQADPTDAITYAVLGEPGARPGGGYINHSFIRERELGLHLWGMYRFAEAGHAFGRAANKAPTVYDRAEMLQRKAEAHAATREWKEARDTLAPAVPLYVQVSINTAIYSDRDKKRVEQAIHNLSVAYTNIRQPRSQIRVMEELVTELENQGLPGRCCYAVQKLAALHWAHGDDEMAVSCAERAYQRYARLEIPGAFADECGALMVMLAYLHAYAGDLEASNQYLWELGHGWCQDTVWASEASNRYEKHKPLLDQYGAKLAPSDRRFNR